MGGSTILQYCYDYRLVALSVAIAVAASYAALELAARLSLARNQERAAWLFGGAVAMGTGIWSMHYTGMIAYRLPVQIYYHVPTVLLSLLAAIGASFVELFVVSRQKMKLLHIAEDETSPYRSRQSAHGRGNIRHALYRYGRYAIGRHAPI